MLGKSLLLPFLVLLFPIEAQETALSLLARYEAYEPFHAHLQGLVLNPNSQCFKRVGRKRGRPDQQCKDEFQWKDNPQKFHRLLALTKKHMDMTDPKNLSSELGQRYQALKNFVSIHEQFKTCEDKAAWRTEIGLHNVLGDLSASASEKQLQVSCEPSTGAAVLSPHILNTINDTLNATHPQKHGELPQESVLEGQILLESLDNAIKERILYAQNFKNQDIKDQSFQEQLLKNLCQGYIVNKRLEARNRAYRKRKKKVCNDQEQALIKHLIEKMIKKFTQDQLPSPIIPNDVTRNINQHIEELNDVFKDYNKEKRLLIKRWAQEDAKIQYPPGRPGTRAKKKKKQARHNHLLKKKKETFNEYLHLFTELHARGQGRLMQTPSMREQMGIAKLEELAPKFFGLIGFKIAALEDKEDFPLLNPIDNQTAKNAVDEAISLTKNQVQDLLYDLKKKQEDDQKYLGHLSGPNNDQKRRFIQSYKDRRLEGLEKLVLTDTGAIGSILINNPDQAGLLCTVAHRLAKDERLRSFGEAGIYVAIGGTLVLASGLTMGGILPVTAILISSGLGIGFAAMDYGYQKWEVKNRKEVHRRMLNAYLAGSGDNRSIEKIRAEWREIVETDYGAGVTLVLGLGDLLVIPAAAKAGFLIRVARRAPNFDTRLAANRKLLRKISSHHQYAKAALKLFKHYEGKGVGELLTFISKLSPKKQKRVLDLLSQFLAKEPLPANILRIFANSDNIKGIVTQAQQTELIHLASRYKHYDVLPASKKIQEVLKSKKFSSIISKFSKDKQFFAAGLIATMLAKGKSVDEIARTFGNLLPIPESLPKGKKKL